MKISKYFVCALTTAIFLGLSSAGFADMSLDGNNSSLSFVSIKKGIAGEVHEIQKLSGSLTESGDLKLVLHLNSLESNIPIRNERMNKMLFETENFPEAVLTAKIMEDLSGDDVKTIKTEATLNLHGVTRKLNVEVMVMRSVDQLIAVSKKPVIISADDFNLGKGIAALQEVAKLSSIATAVPVNFILVFKQ